MALSPVQQQAVDMLVRARVQFAVEQAAPIAPRRAVSAVPCPRCGEPWLKPGPHECAPTAREPEEPRGDGAYLDGQGDEGPAETRPASMEEYRDRLRQRAAAVRSQPGGVDTRDLDSVPQQGGISRDEVIAIAEQVANAVLSRYAQPQMPPAAAIYPPVAPPAPPTSGRFPFSPYYPTAYRR